MFHDSNWVDESLVKAPSNVEISTENKWIKNICNKLESLEPEHINTSDNVTNAERKALEEFKNNPDIIIKKADKTSIMVIMDKDYYKEKLVVADHLATET